MKTVAFEVEHCVDHVLEHARPGNRPFLGHMANEKDRDVARLGVAHQSGGALPNLADAAGRRADLWCEDSLD